MRLQLDPLGPGCSYSGLTSSITALLLATNAAVTYGQQLAKVTAVPVYLPEYEDSDWAALRGSVIGSDKSMTTYTVFCAEQAPTCRIAGDLPFVFTEGSESLKYGGTASSVITADLHCALDGTTAAVCTGSSTFGPSYMQGTLSGPTQTNWVKTFPEAEVTWALLTLATPGPAVGTTDIDGTPTGSLVSSSGGIGITLVPTGESGANAAGKGRRGRRVRGAAAAAAVGLTAGFML